VVIGTTVLGALILYFATEGLFLLARPPSWAGHHQALLTLSRQGPAVTREAEEDWNR
jgi:hypothetical protein